MFEKLNQHSKWRKRYKNKKRASRPIRKHKKPKSDIEDENTGGNNSGNSDNDGSTGQPQTNFEPNEDVKLRTNPTTNELDKSIKKNSGDSKQGFVVSSSKSENSQKRKKQVQF